MTKRIAIDNGRDNDMFANKRTKEATRILVAFSIAMIMAGAGRAEPLDIQDLCEEHVLIGNPDNHIFRGEFKSRGVTLETALVVTPEEIGDPPISIAFYLWGEQPKWDIDDAGCMPGTGSWKGTTYRFTSHWKKHRVKYKFKKDGNSAKVTFSGDGGRKTKGSVERVER